MGYPMPFLNHRGFPRMKPSGENIASILIALFQGDGDRKARVIGIEEPETALNPGAFAALREALQQASEKTVN